MHSLISWCVLASDAERKEASDIFAVYWLPSLFDIVG